MNSFPIAIWFCASISSKLQAIDCCWLLAMSYILTRRDNWNCLIHNSFPTGQMEQTRRTCNESDEERQKKKKIIWNNEKNCIPFEHWTRGAHILYTKMQTGKWDEENETPSILAIRIKFLVNHIMIFHILWICLWAAMLSAVGNQQRFDRTHFIFYNYY